MSDDQKVTIRALRPFEGEEGWKDERSEPFQVSRSRAAELKANGLAEEVARIQKKAPEPENKMASEPANKGDRPVRLEKKG